MTGKDLKNSILQLAIQGKLVPQDANDEPASELLARIRQEKERLVKEKKLKKKDLETTSITDEEKPFEIPESWEWCRLNDIFSHSNGKQLNKGKSTGKMMDYITTSNLYWDKFVLDNLKQMPFEEKEIEKCQAIKGDLLVCEGGDVGRSNIWEKDYPIMLQNHIHKCRSYTPLTIKYFYFLFRHFHSVGLISGKGIGLQGLSSTVLGNIVIPLPPFAEQQRIVAKIEELMPLVEEYDKHAQQLEVLNKTLPKRLRQSVLQQAIMGKLVPQDANDEPASELLARIRQEKERLVKEKKLKKKDLETTSITDEEKPFEIPESWEWTKIQDIFTINPKVSCDNDNIEAAFIPMERIEACYGSSFTYEIAKWGIIKKNYTCFADGDVAFAKITPCFQNRKSLILENLPNGIGAGTTELKVLRQYGETINRKYLLYFLQSSYFIDEATFKGTANQQRIVVGYLENKLFPLPPLAEQQRIVAKVEELFAVIDNLKTC